MDTHTTPRTDPVARQLRAMRERYSYAVNAAVSQGRHEQAAELANAYPDEALQVLTAHLGRLSAGSRRPLAPPGGRRARAAAGLARTRWAWSGVAEGR